jgi:hypothetical protein
MRTYACIILLFPLLTGAETLPDPTRPYGYGIIQHVIVLEPDLPREQVNWRLSGIRIAPKDKTAILNGRLVRVGDMVDGALVVEINPAAVLIDFEEKRIRVDLLKVNIKQDRSAANSSAPGAS